MFVQATVVGIFASIKCYSQVMAIISFGENKTLIRAQDPWTGTHVANGTDSARKEQTSQQLRRV